MANLGTLALGTFTNVIHTTKTGADPVLEVIAAFNDGTYVSDAVNSTHVGQARMALADMPTDFKFMETVSIRVRYLAAAAMTNTWNAIRAQIMKSDTFTPLTNEITVVSSITTTTGTNSSVVAFTGVDTAATLADWNGAIVVLEWDVSKVKGGDAVEKRITAAELTGTYAIDTSINLGDDVAVTDEGVVLVARLLPEAFDTVTVSEDRTLVFFGEPALEVATSDLVFVNEGQEPDEPRINVFDDVAVLDVVTMPDVDLVVAVSEDVLVQDSPAVSPALISMAIVAFDNVRVDEGQVDNLNVNLSVIELITVDEVVAISMNLLRVNVNDVVMLVDASGVDAQGPLGVVAFENVIAQEFLSVNVSVYINAFDEVAAIDGARELEAFDAVSVTDDVTVSMPRLLINVFEPVTVTEHVVGDGLTIEILAGFTAEDVIVAEAVTVLLTVLNASVFEDVAVLDVGTVFVSSISLIVAVFDDVTVVDAIETQTNPMQIDEFTEVVVTDAVDVLEGLLLIDSFDLVTVTEDVLGGLFPMFLSTFDDVLVSERVALRITTGVGAGAQMTPLLPLVGVGR